MYIYKESTLYELLKGIVWLKNVQGEIGLEIETETKTAEDYPKAHYDCLRNGVSIPFKYWNNWKDGSLRNYGMEYVLKKPLNYEEIPIALDEFKKFAKKVPFLPDPVKCSDHVHLNFMNETGQTLGNFLTLYLLYENLLIRYCGPNRLSNMFCLPVKDAEDNLDNILQILDLVKNKNRGIKNLVNEESCKYGSLNVASFIRYGSLEIRCFRGETDTDKLSNWIDILYGMLLTARKKDIFPSDIIDMYFRDEDRLFWSIFRNKGINNTKHLVKENLWYAGKVASKFSSKEWKDLTYIKTIDPKMLTEARDQIAYNRFLKMYEDLEDTSKAWINWYLNEGVK
jgi:hypothetical protein